MIRFLLFCILILACTGSMARSCRSWPTGQEPAEAVTVQTGIPQVSAVQPIGLAMADSLYNTAKPPTPDETCVRRYSLTGTITSEGLSQARKNPVIAAK